MKEKRSQVVAQIKELQSECKPLLTLLEDPSLGGKPGKGDNKEYSKNLQALAEKNSITNEQIESLYKYAKMLFECGNYGSVEATSPMGAAEFLQIYRMLAKDQFSDNAMAALWGKLAAEILLDKWDEAIEDLKKLRDAIDSKVPIACPCSFPTLLVDITQQRIRSFGGAFANVSHQPILRLLCCETRTQH
jgi:translation initiation factor 3 subunit E